MSDTLRKNVERQKQFIAGGTMSLNRAFEPNKLFTRAEGAYLFDADGKKYIDYHAGFAPYLFGHADREIDDAVIEAIRAGQSLIGAGTMPWEAEISEMLVECVPGLEQLQLTSTGSEAVSYALRLARAYTGKDNIILMQGGYNGCSDYVSYNLMDPAAAVESHQPGEAYELRPMTAGIPKVIDQTVNAVEYNDLEAVETLLKKGSIAAVLLEPILQNVGIVKPQPGYLEGLRTLCDTYGAVLIFDEVKTGFRHALGGYQAISGVTPDLCTFGKAVANGYPLAVVGGKREIMSLCNDPDPKRRVSVAGTYNGHPVNVAAARASLQRLKTREAEVYGQLEAMGARLEKGLNAAFEGKNYPTTVVRQGSAFVVYFMDHAPVSWRDVAMHHDMERDVTFRKALIEAGIFLFPVPTKQGSISLAHTEADIDHTIEQVEMVLRTAM